MRRFALLPGVLPPGSFNQTVVMPPPAPPPKECATVAEWKDLASIAAVTVDPDTTGSAATYAGGVYGIAHGTGDYQDSGTWHISIPGSLAPVACRIVLLSGAFDASNLATMLFGAADNSFGYYLKFNIGGVTINVNFSIPSGDGMKLSYELVHDGDYTPTNFRIEYIETT